MTKKHHDDKLSPTADELSPDSVPPKDEVATEPAPEKLSKSAKEAKASAKEAKAAAKAAGVESREEAGATIFSANGVDLLSHAPGASTYTVLADCPKYGYKAGDVKVLCAPFDEQCDHTARELAEAV